MPQLKIPDRYKNALAKVRQLSVEEVDELVAALTHCPAIHDCESVVSLIASQVPTIEQASLLDIVGVLLSMSRIRSDEPTRSFVSDVVTAMNEAGSADLLVPPEEDRAFRERLVKLLDVNPFSLTAKAEDLRSEYERTYCDSRVLTDIRPVFGSDPANRPQGVVVTHTLKLQYHDLKGHGELYVSMDADDLEMLRRALTRAELKAASLKAMLNETGIPELDS